MVYKLLEEGFVSFVGHLFIIIRYFHIKYPFLYTYYLFVYFIPVE